MVENNYSDEVMKIPHWHKVGPFFEMMSKMRESTKKPETIQDFGGYEALSEADQEMIKAKLQEYYEWQVTITVAPPVISLERSGVGGGDGGGSSGGGGDSEAARGSATTVPTLSSATQSWIYVLECEHGCVYVGQTSRDPNVRLQEHRDGNGSAWTRLHPPR